jgi:UDP:flavonoid glycosyltransferase YjiC (YdhE family)
VLHDEVDPGAAVAAERLGLPAACVVVLVAGGFLRPDVVAEPLSALRAEHGLPPQAPAGRPLVLAPLPPGLHDPRFPLPAGTVHVRPDVLEDPVEDVPPRTRPRVHVTLGTVFPQESGDLLRRVVTALAALDVDLVVTTGPAVSPDELGPQRAGVRVERFVAQARVLPHCDAVVCHAGSGSVVGALALGLPLVLLPLGADQPHNADRCAALGVARVLDPVTATAAGLRAAVQDVLRSPDVRVAARRLREQCLALPSAADAVAALEAL